MATQTLLARDIVAYTDAQLDQYLHDNARFASPPPFPRPAARSTSRRTYRDEC